MDLVEMRPVWSMSGSEQLTALDALYDEISRLETYRLQVLAGFDAGGHAKELGARDTAELVSFRHRLDKADVRRDLKLAAALPKYELVSAALPTPGLDGDEPGSERDPAAPDSDQTGEDQTTGDEQADEENADGAAGGDVPVLLHLAQARAIVSALEKVPTTVPVEDVVAAEEQMVRAARHLPPGDLRDLGRQILELLDTDGPEPAEDKAYAREAFWMKNADHGLKFGGFLANENAELLNTLIDANAKPHKTIDGEQDPRSRDKRQADALTTVLNAAAGAGTTGHGVIKPHITVTIDLTDLQNAVAATSNGNGENAEGSGNGGLGGPGGPGGFDGLGALDHTNPGFGRFVYGGNLSAAAVRRLACDAGVVPIILGSDSEPLDVGKEERFVNRAMRRALNFRDRGCVVCGAPPIQCDAHHLIHWIDGGPTAMWNLVLLCRAHHIQIHHGHWTITITGGRVNVTRPTWAEPGRLPRLNRRRPPGAPEHGAPGSPDSAGAPESSGAPGDEGPPRPAPAWPYTSDIPWITPEETARLNPWGDEPLHATPARTPSSAATDTTWKAPWDDDHDTGSPGP
ncbi:HNH endonuclease signature motif containing protein [Kribbella alba]